MYESPMVQRHVIEKIPVASTQGEYEGQNAGFRSEQAGISGKRSFLGS